MSEAQPAPPPERRSDALLDRPLPAGYEAEWARRFAAPETAAADDGGEEARTVLIFRIGPEWLALPAAILQEVAEPRRPHALPHRRDKLVLGIVNVRGELIICVSLATLLGIEAGAATATEERGKAFARMVVVGRDAARVAFEVDEVHGVHRHAAGDVSATPATVGRSTASLISTVLAWDGRAVGRLDGEALLDALDRNIA